MRARLLDTWSGEKVWSSDIPVDDWLEGEFACDCMRLSMFQPRRNFSCWTGDDCIGNERFIVVDVSIEGDEEDAPTLHECNEGYPEELLFSNGVELD
tara:strand:+ start:2704 stop:2994 length:291 start_codon:yes stop_codon:yes gene_type:complete